MGSIALRLARPDDIPEIERLLAAEWLPPMAIKEFLPSFWVLEDDGRVQGCAGIEIYGEAAVLRSVVVAPELRGTGEGDHLVRTALDYARKHEAKTVYLFTMHAAPFFALHGFAPVSTDDFEPAVRESWQYVGLTERPEILKELTPMRLIFSE
jgi:amino-acid N-acetyltransferase